MDCKFDADDIIQYAEGQLPRHKADELSEHLLHCSKCYSDYNALIQFKNRHKNLYFDQKENVKFKTLLSGLMPTLKPLIIAITICALIYFLIKLR